MIPLFSKEAVPPKQGLHISVSGAGYSRDQAAVFGLGEFTRCQWAPQTLGELIVVIVHRHDLLPGIYHDPNHDTLINHIGGQGYAVDRSGYSGSGHQAIRLWIGYVVALVRDIVFGDQAGHAAVNSLGTGGHLDDGAALGEESGQPLLSGLGVQNNHGVRPGIGADDIQFLWPDIGKMDIQAVIANYGTWLENFQDIKYKMLRGDEAGGVQALYYRIVDELVGLHVHRHDLLPALNSDLSGRLLLVNTMSESVASIHLIVNTLCGYTSGGLQRLLMTILETDAVQQVQHVVNALADPAQSIYNISRAVYLDGRTITGLCERIMIQRQQSSVFNSIEISSHDADLYHRAAPAADMAQSRVEVHISGQVFNFLIEERSGSIAGGFTIWGRDVTARESERIAGEVSLALSAPTPASDVAATLALYSAVDWDIEDWTLPADYTFTGAPIDGIQEVAQEAGAIVRAQDDGSLLVRWPYPTRPIDINAAAPSLSYDQHELIGLEKTESLQRLIDAVQVINQSDSNVFMPRLELEEQSPEIGDTVHMRVYWGGRTPVSTSRYATAGSIAYGGTFTERKEELLEITAGAGSVSYPIHRVVRVNWYGASATLSNPAPGDTELVAENAKNGFAVGLIAYDTRYQRLRLSAADVPALIAALLLPAADDVSVEVVASDAAENPVYDDPINTRWLTSASIARARGVAHIDNTHYDGIDATLEAAFNPDAIDGRIAYVNDAQVGERGNYHIMESSIEIYGPVVKNRLTVRKWRT
ncbi:MAG: hypothetical protein SWH61_03260 [Thermodesulfobacteriota bacterium]|nr:hypothetical protein [Thermodesulfobacteriota bacterium]